MSESDNEQLKTLFNIVNTKNFELVMQHLDTFSELAYHLYPKSNLKNEVLNLSAALKKELI